MNAKVTWKNGMSFTGSANTGFELPLGADPSVGGANDGFRPLELMAVSLAGCTAMDVISILRKNNRRSQISRCRSTPNNSMSIRTCSPKPSSPTWSPVTISPKPPSRAPLNSPPPNTARPRPCSPNYSPSNWFMKFTNRKKMGNKNWSLRVSGNPKHKNKARGKTPGLAS